MSYGANREKTPTKTMQFVATALTVTNDCTMTILN